VAADVDELFTTPPTEFVAARNALAKSLKAAGQKEEAAAVAALRRPSVPDWALNTVALQAPDVVADAVVAAEELRAVQAAALGDAGGATDLREAMATTRQAAGALRKAAEDVLRQAGRAGDVSALTSRLNETMVHPGLLAQLEAGRLGTAAVDALDPFSGAPAPATAAPPRTPRSTKTAAPTKAPANAPAKVPAKAKAPEPERIDARAERQARRAAEALERRRAQAKDRLDQAELALAEARTAVRDAEAEVTASSAALERARRAETAARTRLGRAEAQRDEASGRLAAVDA